MTRIDFYILHKQPAKQRFIFACKLIEKAYSLEHRIFVNFDNKELAHQFNDLLWTVGDISFIPHTLYSQPAESSSNEAPVVISYQGIHSTSSDILINFAETAPDKFQQFKRVIEIVPDDDLLRACARQHYSFYRNCGGELYTHDIHN